MTSKVLYELLLKIFEQFQVFSETLKFAIHKNTSGYRLSSKVDNKLNFIYEKREKYNPENWPQKQSSGPQSKVKKILNIQFGIQRQPALRQRCIASSLINIIEKTSLPIYSKTHKMSWNDQSTGWGDDSGAPGGWGNEAINGGGGRWGNGSRAAKGGNVADAGGWEAEGGEGWGVNTKVPGGGGEQGNDGGGGGFDSGDPVEEKDVYDVENIEIAPVESEQEEFE